ncbi:MAG: dTMP kinase [Bacteroidetes bacterium]|nr:dTMP kinase [Bacteroidota bacterium]MBU1677625.1 dTMP kinase [Bacteroidota bacterium]MBU2508044.1 dTMP kinase [Bacteroidota bacterium]
MFITFEGLDFCGKSTQVKLLKQKLEQNNRNVRLIREPGGTKISEQIRRLLLDRRNYEMSFAAELLLFSASRAQLVQEEIIPLLNDGYYVISDRFHDSSIAYQGYGRGINVEAVQTIQKFAISTALPDITFFIDIPVEEVERRKAKLQEELLDRIEVSNEEFYQRVRGGYIKLCAEEKRFRLIDGTKSIEEIHETIMKEVGLINKKDAE